MQGNELSAKQQLEPRVIPCTASATQQGWFSSVAATNICAATAGVIIMQPDPS